MEMHFLVYLFICAHLVLTTANDNDDDDDAVAYQSFCNPLSNNGECSDNLRCRCSTIVPTGERTCTLPIRCASALPCNSNNKCNKPYFICVVDNRCHGQRLCYPISFTSPDICPPLTTNDYTNNEQQTDNVD